MTHTHQENVIDVPENRRVVQRMARPRPRPRPLLLLDRLQVHVQQIPRRGHRGALRPQRRALRPARFEDGGLDGLELPVVRRLRCFFEQSRLSTPTAMSVSERHHLIGLA